MQIFHLIRVTESGRVVIEVTLTIDLYFMCSTMYESLVVRTHDKHAVSRGFQSEKSHRCGRRGARP